MEFSQQILEKYQNMESHKNSSRESLFVSCGKTEGRWAEALTDRQDEADCSFSQFYEGAQKLRLTGLYVIFSSYRVVNIVCFEYKNQSWK